MKIFSGRLEAAKLDEIIKEDLLKKSYRGSLAIVQIGENQISEVFIRVKTRLCDRFGIKHIVYRVNSDLSDSIIKNQILEIINNKNVTGVIIQLPLPRKSLYNLLNLIPLDKDLDCLSDKSLVQLRENKPLYLPPAVRSLKHFLTVNKVKTSNLNVVMIGSGRLVGKPISYFLLHNKASLTIMDSNKEVIKEFSSWPGIKLEKNYRKNQKIKANLVITATNISNLLNGDDLVPGSNVVDFGASTANGKIKGNFNIESKTKHLDNLSLVPGGMGPLVIRYLIMNFLRI